MENAEKRATRLKITLRLSEGRTAVVNSNFKNSIISVITFIILLQK